MEHGFSRLKTGEGVSMCVYVQLSVHMCQVSIYNRAKWFFQSIEHCKLIMYT